MRADFLACVEQVPAPVMKSDDIVIMNNLREHKLVVIREAIEKTDAKLRFLPPSSPIFNQVEMTIAYRNSVSSVHGVLISLVVQFPLNHFKQFHRIIGEHPFHAAIDFAVEAVFRSRKTTSH